MRGMFRGIGRAAVFLMLSLTAGASMLLPLRTLAQEPAAVVATPEVAYRVLPDSVELWECSGPAKLEQSPARPGSPATLLLNWGEVPESGEVRLSLRSALPLAGIKRLEVWACQPVGDGDHVARGAAILRDVKGAEFSCPLIELVNTHIGPATSRKTGIWLKYRFQVPAKAREFVGFSFEMKGKHPLPGGSRLYLRELALDGLDYLREPLYYVVGNYRDNYARIAFNGSGAREMRGDAPEILLDNILDPAKAKRPEEVRVTLRVYDENDRLVCFLEESHVSARDSQDFLHPFVLPVLARGTYRIEGRSYDAASGAYYTTGWTQLVIIRSPRLDPAAERDDPGLCINRALPFGVLQQNDPRRIVFQLPLPAPGMAGDSDGTLDYAVIPWSSGFAGRGAVRKVEFSAHLPATGAELVAEYHPQASAELIVAQLRDSSGRVMDRAERSIGIANGFPAGDTPSAVSSSSLPSALSSPQKKEGRSPVVPAFAPLWVNSILMDIEGQLPGKTPDYIRRNAVALRALGPHTGLYPVLEAMEPLPGVYNTEYLQAILDAGRDANCPVLLYLSEKWPPSWAPVEFYLAPDGTVSGDSFVWRHLCGAYNYAAAPRAVERIRRLNADTARRFGNHPGLAALYFENEHLISSADQTLAASCAPESIDAYRVFLRNRFRTIHDWNNACATHYAGFEEIPYPPLAATDGAPSLSNHEAALWRDYLRQSAESFLLDAQIRAVRSVAPALPLILYSNMLETPASQAFYEQVRDNGVMLANGGVHADLVQPLFREAIVSVPGLNERMEPHTMWSYQPTEFGLEDMLYGMLALGGRGLNFQAFIRIIPWDPDYSPEKLLRSTGFDRIHAKWPVLSELAPTEKLHDSFGILALHAAPSAAAVSHQGIGAYPAGLLSFALNFMGNEQRNPKILFAPGNTAYLADMQTVCVMGEEIAAADATWLEAFVKNGGRVVLTPGAASVREDGTAYDLVTACGAQKRQEEMPSDFPGASFSAGRGRIHRLDRMPAQIGWDTLGSLLIRTLPEEFPAALTACDTPGMRVQVLQNGATFYLVAIYFPQDRHVRVPAQNEVRPVLRFAPPRAFPDEMMEVQEIWQDGEARVISRQKLEEGMEAGTFRPGEMKLFRIRAKQL